ncbi:MAG: folate family ECF transporter S component [Clostridia bacterium]|nr:folate family ECF transporter S component [Clostridia bacterium]
MKRKFKTSELVICAILVACHIILSRFLSINAWHTKIGFTFVPVLIAAYVFGPVLAGIVGGLGDLIGALAFPIGAYFPGFTFTCFLTGVIYGVFFYNKSEKQMALNIPVAVIINQIVCSLILNTLWISILYGSSFKVLLATRSVQAGIMTAVEIVVMLALVKVLPKFKEMIKK